MINYKFLEENKDKLIQLYVKERVLNYGRLGALFIDFTKPENIQVYFLTLQNMPEHIRNEFLKKENLNQNNTVFLYVKDETNYEILDILV